MNALVDTVHFRHFPTQGLRGSSDLRVMIIPFMFLQTFGDGGVTLMSDERQGCIEKRKNREPSSVAQVYFLKDKTYVDHYNNIANKTTKGLCGDVGHERS